jgi:anti-anti-sigma regulatory factor
VNLTCEDFEKTRNIRVFGDLNRLELSMLEKCLRDLGGVDRVEIDLTEADFAGTDFINLLVEVRRRRPEDSAKIVFVNPNDLITELMTLTQLNLVYRIIRPAAVPAQAD